jgi:hypothetical protein
MAILKTALNVPLLRRFTKPRRLGRKIKRAGRRAYNRLSLKTRSAICIAAVVLSVLVGAMTPVLFG